MCRVAEVCGIKKIDIELARKAIQILIDKSDLSNRKVANQVGVDEGTVRYWKKHPFWEEEKQKILSDRQEVIKKMIETNQEEYIQELKQEHEDLKKLRNAAKTMSVLYYKMANNTLTQLTAERDAVKASGKASKSGVNKHSDSAIKAAEAIARLNEQIYQIGMLVSHLEKIEQSPEEE